MGLTFTPLFNFPLKIFLDSQDKIDNFKTAYNFYLVCFLFLYSSYVKYVREELCNYLKPANGSQESQNINSNKNVKYAKMNEERDERKEKWMKSTGKTYFGG